MRADRPLPLISGCCGWFSNCNGFYPISSLLSERNHTQKLPTGAHTHWCTHTWPVQLQGEPPDRNTQVNIFCCRCFLFVCINAYNESLSLISFSFYCPHYCVFPVLALWFCSCRTANMLSFFCMFKEAPAWVWSSQVRLLLAHTHIYFLFFHSAAFVRERAQ